MPRYRKLHTKTVYSLDVNDMPDDFTRLFWVLLPLGLSREGTALDHAGYIKSKVFPLREDVTHDVINGALDWFAAHDMIRRYQAGERRYFHQVNFARYQGNTLKEAESDFPPPPEQVTHNSRPTPDLLQTNSVTDAVCSIQYSDADASAVFTAYENNIGVLTPILSEKIKCALNEYPTAWILESIDISVEQNKRSLAYAEAILRRWQTDGKDNGRGGKREKETVKYLDDPTT